MESKSRYLPTLFGKRLFTRLWISGLMLPSSFLGTEWQTEFVRVASRIDIRSTVMILYSTLNL